MITPEYIYTAVATALVIVLCVMLHYESLRALSAWLPMPKHHHRRRIILLILSLLLIHIIEVWIFGIAYFGLLKLDGFGALLGTTPIGFIDCIYYSASVYTTVGFGDIYPVGAIRVMTGTEAITGLTMITWSASYTFVEMFKTWNNDG